MPYKHAGEIGDVWKHIPLCDILMVEKPRRYFETNSAYSQYSITSNERTEYGIFQVLRYAQNNRLSNSAYIKLMDANNLEQKMLYLGSPGQAMTLLGENVEYFFHDLEQEALDDVYKFAITNNIQSIVKTRCVDSITAFLHSDYVFNNDDFVFLDPYSPFDANEKGDNFLAVFEKVIQSNAKTLFWYGYDNLNGKNEIHDSLNKLSQKLTRNIFAFDVWQASMTDINCDVNPGVPGCGLAAANLSEASIDYMNQYLFVIKECYSGALYNGYKAALRTEAVCFGNT